MRKVMAFCVLALLLASVGCQALRQAGKGIVSQTAGIRRHIIHMDYSGHMLGQWTSVTTIDGGTGGTVTFFDSLGGRVLVAGGIIQATEIH